MRGRAFNAMIFAFAALAAFVLLKSVIGWNNGFDMEVYCVKCETRNTSMKVQLSYPMIGKIEGASVSLVHESGRFAGSYECLPVVENVTAEREQWGNLSGEAECIAYAYGTKKAGKYTATVELWKNGNVVASRKAEIHVKDSGLLPPNLHGRKIYKIGETILNHPLSGSKITGVSYRDVVRALKCGPEYAGKIDSCMSSCKKDCETKCSSVADTACGEFELLPRESMKFAVIRYTGTPGRTSHESERSLVMILLGSAIRTNYYISLMDEWDAEYMPYLPRKGNNSIIISRPGTVVFEIPESGEARYLVGKKSSKGVVFLFMPVSRDSAAFAVDLS